MTQSLFKNDAQHSRQYLALFLPWLAAERAIRSGIAPPDTPFVLIEKRCGALRIAALSPQAAELGLETGLPLADARGHLPELVSVAYDSSADTALLERLVRTCMRYTPSAALDPPQGVMLDITGCVHLHGDEEKLRQKLLHQMHRLRLTARAAIAATPDAARALACFDSGNVHKLPIAALETAENIHHALHHAGFRTIGDLAELPRAPLSARFGKEMICSLERLLEHEDPHITPHHSIDPIVERMRFPEPVIRSDDVLEVIESLTQQVEKQLAWRGEGGRAFAVSLYRSDGHIARLSVATGMPVRDPAVVLRLFRERIDSLADPLDPGFGYDSIDLAVPRSEALEEQQEELTHHNHQYGDISPLLDRLMVRYGSASVLRFTGQDSHIPERMGSIRPLDDIQHEIAYPLLEPDEPPQRPLMLFDPPQKIQVLASIPDSPPKRFHWRGESYLVIAQEGPKRIAPEWWRRRKGYHENPGLTRDYYHVEEEGGHRFWLFRHGLYNRETREPDWYIHGLFA